MLATLALSVITLKASLMFHEKTIKLMAIISFALILLWVVVVYVMKIGANPNTKLVYILAVLVWACMYFVFSLLTSKLALGLAVRLSNSDFLRVYGFYKYFLSQEARLAWESELKSRGLND
jgi:hypothetical protein